MTMSKKENGLAAYYGEKHDYVPYYGDDVALIGMAPVMTLEMPQVNDAKDYFGGTWMANYMGSIPKPGSYILEDIADWEKVVKFPDLDQYDFRAMAAAEMANPAFKPDEQVMTAWGAIGPFTRLDALMGTTGALCALVQDPDACKSFFERLSEHVIDYANRCIEAYHPDVYFLVDDVATAKSTFMSPEMYRELIEPATRVCAEAVRKHDIPVGMHTCGKCEEIIPDYVDMGISAWNSAQSMNDLTGILKEGLITPEGGWDSTGPCSATDTTLELVAEETRRCLTEYKYPRFVFMPYIMNERGNSLFVGDDRLDAARQVWEEMRWFD